MMLGTFQVGFRDLLQIAIMATALYYLLRYVRGTRAAAIMMGIGIMVMMVFVAIRVLNLDVIGWLLGGLAIYLALSAVIVFQPEFRRGLAILGKHQFFNTLPWQMPQARHVERVSDKLFDVIDRLADRNIGALIAIERSESLGVYAETGVQLASPLVSELLQTIFYPPSPLHDGGVVVSGEQIVAAGCIFPLAERMRPELRGLGTRHQAAVGLSDVTDAVVVVVSEETGVVSIAHEGKLYRGMRSEALQRYLRVLDPLESSKPMTLGRFLERLNQPPEQWNLRRLRTAIRRRDEERDG